MKPNDEIYNYFTSNVYVGDVTLNLDFSKNYENTIKVTPIFVTLNNLKITG